MSGRQGYEFPAGIRDRHKESLRFRCQCCGKKCAQKDLEAHHHLIYAAEAGARAFDPNIIKIPFNMLHVCRACHLLIHARDEQRTEEQIQAAYERLQQEAKIEEIRRLEILALYRYLYPKPAKQEIR